MPRAITAICNFNSPMAMANLDSWQGAAMGVQCTPTGGGAFSLDYSFDNPNDLTWPIALADMMWDASMIPGGSAPSFNPITFSLPTSPIWIRLRHMNGLGQSRAVFLQVASHSRSNITSQSELLVTGPNFGAVHNGAHNGYAP